MSKDLEKTVGDVRRKAEEAPAPSEWSIPLWWRGELSGGDAKFWLETTGVGPDRLDEPAAVRIVWGVGDEGKRLIYRSGWLPMQMDREDAEGDRERAEYNRLKEKFG